MSDAWSVLPLNAVADVKRNRIDPRNLGDRTLVHYSIPALDATDHPIHESASSIASHKFSVLQDSVLVSLLNPRIPRVWYAIGAPNAVCSTEFAVLEPSTDVLSVPYLYYLCQSPLFVEELQKRAVGTTGSRQRAKVDSLLSISIPVPPPLAQRRIVDLMAHLDNHLANMRREYETSLTLLDRARIEMTDNWRKIPLKEVCSIKALLVDPRIPEHSGRPHIGIDRIVKDIGELLPLATAAEEKLVSGKYLFGPLDVIYSKIRPNLRKVVFPETEGLCSADAYPLTPAKGVPSELLREVLLLPSVVDAVVGKSGRTKMPKVNRRELFEVLIPMSADLEERLTISEHLKKIREVCRTLNLEVRALSLVRERCLKSLLLNEIRLPESYDTFLTEVA